MCHAWLQFSATLQSILIQAPCIVPADAQQQSGKRKSAVLKSISESEGAVLSCAVFSLASVKMLMINSAMHPHPSFQLCHARGPGVAFAEEDVSEEEDEPPAKRTRTASAAQAILSGGAAHQSLPGPHRELLACLSPLSVCLSVIVAMLVSDEGRLLLQENKLKRHTTLFAADEQMQALISGGPGNACSTKDMAGTVAA